MVKIENSGEEVKRFLDELRGGLAEWVVERIERRLESEVDDWLHRQRHVRRNKVKRQRTGAECQRCGSQRAQNFSRNGHRKRQLVTTFGVLTIRLPRVVCECGGSVSLPLGILTPYQRLWDDVVEQVGRWADLGLSLRQMQEEIGVQWRTQMGLRTLNTIVREGAPLPEAELRSVPPIILLDGIWVTLLEDGEDRRQDRQGRQRQTKTREKVCVLVALGLYPQSGRWGILGWHLADGEDQAAWEALLLPLEQRGLYRERGVALFIHDGGKGLMAALNLLYPNVPHQRCLFHKLRNLWHAIQPPKDASRTEKQAFKRDLLHQVHAIFEARTVDQAEQLRDALVLQWRDQQPKFVATLCRDWPETIAFFRVLDHFPTWPRRFLRTTSLLERVNRMIRRLFRSAGAFHSPSGILAAVSRVLAPVCLI